MIPLIYILNLFDAASTHYLVATNQATETNLFMHLVLSTSWWLFWYVKAVVVGALCVVLYKQRTHKWVVMFQGMGLFIYTTLALYHVSILAK